MCSLTTCKWFPIRMFSQNVQAGVMLVSHPFRKSCRKQVLRLAALRRMGHGVYRESKNALAHFSQWYSGDRRDSYGGSVGFQPHEIEVRVELAFRPRAEEDAEYAPQGRQLTRITSHRG
jgi:hypothetical protein